MPVAAHSQVVTFGPYEVDFAAGEVRKNGLRVRLQQQPFRVLAILLERPGELVTRDELKQRLWPTDVFVDFDHSLNKAVNKLRTTLCDTHAPWRYIETVPRQGYRFVAPVRKVATAAMAAAAAGAGGSPSVPTVRAAASPPSSHSGSAANLSAPSMPVVGIPADETPAGPQDISAADRPAGKWLTFSGIATLLVSLAFLLAVWLVLPRRNMEMTTVPLTSYAGRERQGAISPDGEKLAFLWMTPSSDDFELYVKLVSGGTPLRLTAVAGEEFSPAWSPDNQEIAFYRAVSEGHEIRTIHALGGDERKVGFSRASGTGFGLSWSPDGHMLAIVDRENADAPNAIFLLDLRSGRKQRLTSPAAADLGDAFPSFSPDGEELAFIRTGKLRSEVFVLPARGGRPRQVTFDDYSSGGLSWSADGSAIVYATQRPGGSALWRVPRGGGTPEPLPIGAQSAHYPSIARTRPRLVYTDYKLDTNIWRIPNANVRGLAPLVSSTRLDDSPAYSPDGRRIAFISDRSGFPEVWASNADGGDAVQLTAFNSRLVGSPKFSPDGREIAFDARPRGDSDIFVVNAESGVLRQITSGESDDYTPNWSRDGGWIYFSSSKTGPHEIYKVASQGGQPVQVTHNGGFECWESPDGRTLYFSKARVAGIWSMPVAGGEEALVPELAQVGAAGRRYWAVTASGIYFVPSGRAPLPIHFWSFKTRKITTVGRIERDAVGGPPGLAVSPDERWIVFTQIDRRDSDISLVENFR